MPRVKETPQTAMWDRTVEDPDLVDAIERLQDSDLRNAARAIVAARKTIKERLAAHNATAEERIRVGKFVLTTRSLSGGGFEVPEWETVALGGVTEAE